MGLVSFKFAIFAAFVVLVYFLMPKSYRWMVLLVASIIFYINAGKRALATLIIVTIFCFFSAIAIEQLRMNEKKCKMFLILSIAVIVAWLTLEKIAGIRKWSFGLLVAPLGMSYISFSLIGYLADVYWEKDKAEKNFLKFLLYVLYFPKVTQGPITKHKGLSDQLSAGGDLSYDNTCFGIQRMVYGYFKKMVVADRIAPFTGTVFADVSQYSGSIILIAVVASAICLYCDFSGYMDIILGFTQILGIEMEENFDHPFFSRNAAEFWRRWHITLGVWFKDYVYTPVAMSHIVKKWGKWGRKNIGKRFGNALIKVVALSIVWVLTGLWHGTGLNYILWGIYWGSMVIMSAVFEPEINKVTKILRINTDTISWKWFQMARTFFLFCFGVMLTDTNNLYEVKTAVCKILFQLNIWELFDGTLYSLGMNKAGFDIAATSVFIIFLVSIMQKKVRIRKYIVGLNAPVRWFLYALSVSVILLFGIYGTGSTGTSFVYAHF